MTPTDQDPQTSAIARLIDADRDAMVALLAALVAVPTENPPGRACLPCIDLLTRAATDLGLDSRRIDIASPADAPRAALHAWSGPPGPTLYFHGHYDVVPASAPDQFEPRIEGDALFGRGSSDMKSGLVAMLYAAKAVAALSARRHGRLGLTFVPDEETGGEYGSAALAAIGELATDAVGMLLPEPTSGVIWNANRGAISLEVTVKGRASHVGLAHLGVNAFEGAVAIVNRLMALKAQVDPSILLVGGRVEAGTNFNLVPDSCRFTIDRRIDPGESLDTERRRLMDVLDDARAGGTALDVRVLQEGRASASSEQSPLGRMLAESINEVTGRPPVFEMCPGLLETRFYATLGVTAFAYGPGVLAVSHGPREFVRISRMIESAKVYALTAARVLARL
ncbi:MAG TPA: M20/M25/M40 family metallo-hydrolase [Vicinamibacterales bacterium]|jgi:acetylornithine deacetylase/succinyl-diaminopimelate desuccinylase family protein|nr:M20/M25/M40 family metallo-hydrolase [Vicinamibacterales bacterium]